MKQLENIAKASPAEIDTVWAGVWERAIAAENRVASIQHQIKKYRRSGLGVEHYEKQLPELIEKRDALIAKAKRDEAPLKAEFDRRGGWTRYTVVPGGHYHRYQGCSSFRWRTTVLWTPQHSGKSEAQLVAEMDETACTKCFPSAPVAPRSGAKPGECKMSRTNVEGEILEAWRAHNERRAGYAYPGLHQTFCPHCGKKVSVTKAGRFPGHKDPAKK